MKSWLRLARLFDNSGRVLALSLAVAVGQAAMLLPIVLLVRHVFDTEIPDRDTTGILLTGVLLLALYVGSGGLNLLALGLMVGTTKRAVARLRRELLTRLYALPRAWYDHHRAGLVHSVLVQDSEHLDRMLGQLVTQVIPALL